MHNHEYHNELRQLGAPPEKKMSRNKKGPPDFRSAKSGKFVTEKYAKTHPSTTEKEHNRPPPKKGK
jgi:hypothetical protein